MKKIILLSMFCTCLLFSCKKENTSMPEEDDNNPDTEIPTKNPTGIFFEGSNFSGSVLITYTDSTTTTGDFQNGKFKLPVSSTGLKTIKSLMVQNQQPILIGRKEGDTIRLNYDGTTLKFRTPDRGYTPIGTYAELQMLNSNTTALSGAYKQEARIDLMSLEWTPIGTNNNPFKGVYDGNGCELLNIKINSTLDYVGLFGKVISPSEIRNITLKSGSILGYYNNNGGYTGGIAAWANIIENCQNYATIQGKNTVAGIAGAANNIKDCNNYANITSDNGNAGGITTSYTVGGSGNIENCTNSGNITGLTGATGIGNTNGNIVNAYNTGIISCKEGTSYGIGSSSYGLATIENCTNKGKVSSIIGVAFGIGSAGFIKNCDNTEEIRGGDSGMGLFSKMVAGIGIGNTIQNCNNTGIINCTYGTAVGIGTVSGSGSSISNCHNKAEIVSLLGSAAGIGFGSALLDCTNTANISGSTGAAGIALQGGSTECKNTGIIKATNGTAAGIVNEGTAYYCTNSGTVISQNGGAGGISAVGAGSYNKNTVNVTGKDYVGGIFGKYNSGSMRVSWINNSNSGNVIGDNYVGGIIGYSTGTYPITDQTQSYNTGNVTGNNYIGGIVGFANAGLGYVQCVYNSGKISGNDYVGGLVGQFLESNINPNLFVNSYNEGNVIGKNYVGGAFGWVSYSYFCNANYSIGSVNGLSNVGILIGYADVFIDYKNYMGLSLYFNYWTDIESDNAQYVIGNKSNAVFGKKFSALDWPSEFDFSVNGRNLFFWRACDYVTCWKTLGSWNGGNPIYPKLWFEN